MNFTDRPIRMLALGDSYTVGESVVENERWPVQLSEELGKRGIEVKELKIIAKTGWRVDQLMEAVKQEELDENWDLVTLLIGVNDHYQGRSVDSYEEIFPEILHMAITLAREDPKKVMVLSIPDYAYTPFGRDKDPMIISSELHSFNRINRIVSKRYGARYVNITRISKQGLKNPELVAQDGLHPSGKQYAYWVKEVLNELFN